MAGGVRACREVEVCAHSQYHVGHWRVLDIYTLHVHMLTLVDILVEVLYTPRVERAGPSDYAVYLIPLAQKELRSGVSVVRIALR